MSSNNKNSSESQGRVFSKGNGLQELILDPKNTVRKYIENTMGPSDQMKHDPQAHQNGAHLGDVSSLVPSYIQHDAHRPSNAGIQTFPPYPAELQSPPVGPPATPPRPVTAPYQSQQLPSQQAYPYRIAGTEMPDKGLVGPAPPPAEPATSEFPAPRLYHRMITEYQTITTIFYMAKSQPSHNDLSPLASRLKYLAREIWNLRYSRAAEFPYNLATTEERVTEWKAQYEYWADVLDDLLDPRYVARAQLEEREQDWAGIAGLSSAPGAVPTIARKKAVAKVAAPVASDGEEEAPAAAPVVKKKVVKKVAADGEAAPVKKKVAKKTAVAAE
ncbi:hypothetical protein BX600DRAFT_440307 [Xylariales sp. PMI_506]|nr:hypothetical protein BX600DRAFT_440307 [Xylariales sp. PMI_506]